MLKASFNFNHAAACNCSFSLAKFTKRAPHPPTFANLCGNPRFAEAGGGQKAARFARFRRDPCRFGPARADFALPARRVLRPACARPKWHS